MGRIDSRLCRTSDVGMGGNRGTGAGYEYATMGGIEAAGRASAYHATKSTLHALNSQALVLNRTSRTRNVPELRYRRGPDSQETDLLEAAMGCFCRRCWGWAWRWGWSCGRQSWACIHQ